MKISTKGRYGLRAMIDLAVHSKEGHISLSSIAERQKLSLNYLEQAFSALKKNRLIKSVKGAQGGYVLADLPNRITVYQILSVLEGDLSIADDAERDETNLLQACIKTNVWDKIDAQVYQLFTSLTLQDLMNEMKGPEELQGPMYYI